MKDYFWYFNKLSKFNYLISHTTPFMRDRFSFFLIALASLASPPLVCCGGLNGEEFYLKMKIC